MSSSVDLVCVDPQRVDEVWPHVAHFIKEAMRRGDLGTYDAVERDVLNGDALLWLAWCEPNIESVVVSQIGRTELSRVCTIIACGGTKPKRWIGLLRQIELYASEQGCDCVRILGRKGWARLLKDYRTAKIVLEKRLS